MIISTRIVDRETTVISRYNHMKSLPVDCIIRPYIP